MRRRSSWVLAGVWLGSTGACVARDRAPEAVVEELRDPDAEESAFIRRINEYRASMGVGPLVATPLLNQVAYDHSLDMGTRNYFDHNTPEGVSPFQRMARAGYTGGGGENIAAGNASAASTFEQWRTSPGHNANMLNGSFRAMGIGRASVPGSRYGYYWTNVFGFSIDPSATDAGTPPRDTGVAPQDTGSVPRDTGSATVDTGSGLPGDLGASCTVGSGCSSGLCVRGSAGGAAFCSSRCTGDCACPDAWRCVTTSVAGLMVCVPGASTCVRIDPTQDTGVAPRDTGVAPRDTGVAPRDTGVAPRDTGVAPRDTGVAAADTGVAPEDVGVIEVDAGEDPGGTVTGRGLGTCAAAPGASRGAPWFLLAALGAALRRRRRG